jgi:hypothetical protein
MTGPAQPPRAAGRHATVGFLAAIAAMLLLASPAHAADQRAARVPLEPALRSGQVALAAGDVMSPAALEQALRADAALLWQRADGGAGLAIAIEAVTWRDGALGCPQPDRLYTQALVPGWRVQVADDARRISYHASRSGFWLLCPAGRAQPPLPDAATR